TFAYEPFNIPSGSMKPTLLVGDYLFVSKLAYGYSRYSFPFGWPPFAGRIWSSPVQRGDVVVFKHPPRQDQDYIRRLIGLPGDRTHVKNGILNTNGQPVQREPIGEWVDEDGTRYQQYIETLPNGVKHRIIESTDQGQYDNTDEVTVQPGHYFAMGDNR